MAERLPDRAVRSVALQPIHSIVACRSFIGHHHHTHPPSIQHRTAEHISRPRWQPRYPISPTPSPVAPQPSFCAIWQRRTKAFLSYRNRCIISSPMQRICTWSNPTVFMSRHCVGGGEKIKDIERYDYIGPHRRIRGGAEHRRAMNVQINDAVRNHSLMHPSPFFFCSEVRNIPLIEGVSLFTVVVSLAQQFWLDEKEQAKMVKEITRFDGWRRSCRMASLLFYFILFQC